MELNTKKLRIIPLTIEQFEKFLEGTEQVEMELNLEPSNESLDEHTQFAMEELYKIALNNKKNYLWYTNWQIILKEENKYIGSACFMKKPDKNGIVEIGYGINSDYQNKGYMTEALHSILDWAFEQKNVTCIIAETDKCNIQSHKVLQKCGMIEYKEDEKSIWWKLNNEHKKD